MHVFCFFILTIINSIWLAYAQNLESRYSPAQKAIVLVFSRSVEAGIEKGLDSGSNGSSVAARLVVSSNQVGCLLGKGGSIITEMRKATGTGIKIFGTDQAPKCASQNDQLVQVCTLFFFALYKQMMLYFLFPYIFP